MRDLNEGAAAVETSGAAGAVETHGPGGTGHHCFGSHLLKAAELDWCH